jgi:hypothetical protein
VKWSHTKRGLNKSIRDLNQFIVFYTKSILWCDNAWSMCN